jgi:outer membrane protein OmpA-like peptidoglycan-associated protein
VPLNSRPLFLVPSLMRELPDTGAVMVDVTDLEADELTATSATAAANALLDQLEPLIVEANLAGYEITVIAATTGKATSSCLVINVEAFLVDSANEPWNTVVTGVNGNPFGANVTAALALRFEPRLAMREAIGDGGSDLASSYGIEFDTPSGWIGKVDADDGGWLVTTTSTATTLPAGLTTIAGRPGNPSTPAAALSNAIRTAATAQWQAHGRGPGQLTHCGLAPLFDPSTWQVPAGDEGVSLVAAVLSDYVWDPASGSVPAYGELAGFTLAELLNRGGGHSGEIRGLDQIRSALREELIRRHLVDPKAIDGLSRREGELGPRFDELFAALETIGQPLAAVDLFRMLELGLMSLERRVAAEEMLPVLVEREWTEPVLTGFYDSVGEITSIPIGELVGDADARGWFDSVAAEAVVVSINQAGDHLEGFWHERQYDPESDEPVTVVEWFGAGERDHARPGLVYDVQWQSGGQSMTGTYTFREVDGGLEVVADWNATGTVEAGTMTFRRRDLSRPVLEPGEEEAVEPPAPMVRVYWSTGEIDALPDEIREPFRIVERYSLHPAEMVLLDAVVGRIAEDLGAIAQAVGQSSDERMALCANLATAFGYFVRGNRTSEHASTARRYVLAALMSMRGNNTPIDSWADYAPETYFHALAKAHQEFACIPDRIAECLGLERKELAWFATDHKYQFRFHTSLSPTKLLKGFAAGEIKDVVKLLATKGALIGSKLKKPGPSYQYDEIEAEIQKFGPYLAGQDNEWPRTGDTPPAPQSVWYDGVLGGGAFGVSAGMSVSATTEWTSIESLGDYWTRQDFEGGLWIAGIFWGLSVFGLETVVFENPTNWLREKLGYGAIRYNGDVSYTKFMAPPKADIWTLCRGFTNSLGLHVEVGANSTYGELWLRGQEPDLDELLPDVDRPPLQITAVSFDTGRSELTPDGHGLLRQAAADRLHELSSPATSLDVVGHASFGDARPLYNLTLSQRRAANVVRALRAYLGPLYAVRPERTTAIGLGDQQAEEDGGPPEQWRRVDVFINGQHAVQLGTEAP